MPRLEATLIGFKTPPNPEQLADPVARLSAEFIGLLRDIHQHGKAPLTRRQGKKLDAVVAKIVKSVPDINEASLRKMVSDSPLNHGFSGGNPPYDFGEFHVIALNWNNSTYGALREIAEKDYEVTKPVVDFLVKGARILPPPPPVNAWRYRAHHRLDFV